MAIMKEVFVDSPLCCERFSTGYSGFLLSSSPQKPTFDDILFVLISICSVPN